MNDLEADPALAESLTPMFDTPDVLLAHLQSLGYDATPQEIYDAFLEAHGDKLSEEQLAAVAGGLSGGEVAGIAVGAAVGGFGAVVGVTVAVTASAAAAAI